MFKKSFKYYKSKVPEPSLNDVLDFSNNTCIIHQTESIFLELKAEEKYNIFGLRNPKDWKVYKLKTKPGLIFIENPFTSIGQRYWTVRCLKDYPRCPNKTNLKDISYSFDLDISLINALRWATLGYHHNWDTKVYTEDNKNKFPNDLGNLLKYIADVLQFDDFIAEAAIVNFYHMNSTLSGHTDHSEENLDAPLFSISFGQSAIFLLGGESLDDEPLPILIRSGDIVIMSKQSRLCYHGVPKILKNNECKWNNILEDECIVYKPELTDILEICLNDEKWLPFNNYLKNNRINMNEEELKDIIEKAREMEDKYGHFFDMVIVNNDTERAYHQLLAEINSLEREPQWVPAAWVKSH